MAGSFRSLTERDLAILRDVYRLRYATTTQIQTAQFRNRKSKTPGYRALARLSELGLIEAFTVANVPERIFRLTKHGAQVYADGQGQALDELKLYRPGRDRPVSPFFMRHFLGVGDVRLAIERDVEQTPGVELPVWVPEYASNGTARRRPVPLLRATVATPQGELGHTPDAAFVLEGQVRSRLYLLEYDRGTEGLSNPDKGFLRLIRFYLQALNLQVPDVANPYAWLGASLTSLEPSFTVLVVFETEARQSAVVRTLRSNLTPDGQALLTRFLSAVAPLEQPLTRQCWHSLQASDAKVYKLKDLLGPPGVIRRAGGYLCLA